jgi:hypothetical protein
MACWSNSIADLGFWIAEFNSDFDLILIISIRNPLTPLRHYATFEILPRVAAFITNTLEDHPAGENPKALPNLFRYIQVIVLIAVKIKYFPAEIGKGRPIQCPPFLSFSKMMFRFTQ